MREHFRPTGNPVADPACVLTGNGYRICVLADGLVRLEYSASGEFEDRASQAVGQHADAVTVAGEDAGGIGDRVPGRAEVLPHEHLHSSSALSGS